MKYLRTYLVTGLLVWVPLVITLFILKLLVDFMDQTLLLLPVFNLAIFCHEPG